MLDTAQDGEADLKAWPAIAALFVALMLGIAGIALLLRYENGDVPLRYALPAELAILTMIFTAAWIVHRWQTRGGVFFNVQKARRGFRVVTTPKDKK